MKVFLASSNELNHERIFLAGDVCWNLNGLLCDLGSDLRVDPVKWEFLDSSMGVDHKQDEYNRELATCDAVVVLFWRKFGEYTASEFRTGLAGLRTGGKIRRLAVLFKETDDAPSPELVAFRQGLPADCGIQPGGFASDAELRGRFLSVVFDSFRDANPGFAVPGKDMLARYQLA